MRHRTPDRPTRPPTASAVALLACLIALGCGSGESPTPEPAAAPPEATPAAMPAAPGGAEAAIPEQEVISTEGVIPEGYPSDVPVYPGSDPGPWIALPGLGMFATFESDDSVEAIITHFRGELTNKGWAVADVGVDGLDATKEDRTVQVRVRATESSGRSEIAVDASD